MLAWMTMKTTKTLYKQHYFGINI